MVGGWRDTACADRGRATRTGYESVAQKGEKITNFLLCTCFFFSSGGYIHCVFHGFLPYIYDAFHGVLHYQVLRWLTVLMQPSQKPMQANAPFHQPIRNTFVVFGCM